MAGATASPTTASPPEPHRTRPQAGGTASASKARSRRLAATCMSWSQVCSNPRACAGPLWSAGLDLRRPRHAAGKVAAATRAAASRRAIVVFASEGRSIGGHGNVRRRAAARSARGRSLSRAVAVDELEAARDALARFITTYGGNRRRSTSRSWPKSLCRLRVRQADDLSAIPGAPG